MSPDFSSIDEYIIVIYGLRPLLEGLTKGSTVYADKDYGQYKKQGGYGTALCVKPTATAR